jgi:lipopolysaccharide/colanic/teichoic acid biosynthesis glycosyltransferase
MSLRPNRKSNVNADKQFLAGGNTDVRTEELSTRVKSIGDPALAVASRRINARGKRMFDLVVGIPAFVFLLPAIVSIALALRLARSGPALERVTMIGRRGKPFVLKAFRTRSVRSGAGDQGEAAPAGALSGFLEATDLHRLPAFINVLAGDLSFVGPRPVNAEGLERYGSERRYYLVARPGLVSPWRDPAEKAPAAPCRDYVLNWRLRHDIKTVWQSLASRVSA